MKKLSLLIGTIGGALAGYVMSKDQLRTELGKAKDAEDAAKILGKHLSKDGKKLGAEMQAFVDSPEVQKNWKKAKTYAEKQFTVAKKQMGTMLTKAKTKAKKTASKAKKASK